MHSRIRSLDQYHADYKQSIEDPDAFNGAVIDFLKANGLWAGTTIPGP